MPPSIQPEFPLLEKMFDVMYTSSNTDGLIMRLSTSLLLKPGLHEYQEAPIGYLSQTFITCQIRNFELFLNNIKITKHPF